MFPISWYVYLVFIFFMLYLTLKGEEGMDTNFIIYWVGLGLLLALTSYAYFGEGLLFGSAITTTVIAGLGLVYFAYYIFDSMSDYYFVEEEDDDDEEDDDYDYDDNNKIAGKVTERLEGLALATVSAKNVVDLDVYAKPVNKEAIGNAMLALMKSGTTDEEAAEALAILNEAEQESDDDDDDSETFIGHLLVWLMIAPVGYYAYTIIARIYF